jgi:beta-glucosidase
MPWLDQVTGVFEVWYPDVEQGSAIAGLLWGDVNPSGKLPQTFPASATDLPTAGSTRQYPGVFSDGSTTRPAGTQEVRQVYYDESLKVGRRSPATTASRWAAHRGIRRCPTRSMSG